MNQYPAERKEAILRQMMPPENRPVSALASSADKFGVVLETARMNEAELAQYCRGKGLFVEQVADWREACQQANAAPVERNRELRAQVKNDRKEIKQLQKDLQRKEKALAEAAALIILRKKAQAIWGSPRTIDRHPRSPPGDWIG